MGDTETPASGSGTSEVSDEEIVRRVVSGETGLFEVLMRRHNQRVYRVARSVLTDDALAEELAQDAWVRVYERLGQFAGQARFSTWLTKVVVHEAWAWARKARRFRPITEEMTKSSEDFMTTAPDPEARTLGGETRRLLDAALDALPEPYRIVLVLRDVDELSTAETADALDLSENAVKVRLHRARAMVRRALADRIGPEIRGAFPFLGDRCDRVVATVMDRVARTRVAPGRRHRRRPPV